MANEVQNQRAYGASNHIILSLCLITTCLLNITTQPPATEQGSHIVLWVNLGYLAVGYVLAMASVFSNDTEMKAAVAKLSVISAWLSTILVMMGELSSTAP
ncbi:unnamed protein product [Urochloa decumbens]|uniref:Uncharacterized protein n=1 Tax=Urochloa decumbens TaxID=240449 RepID=A0ABC9DBL1_9POAL